MKSGGFKILDAGPVGCEALIEPRSLRVLSWGVVMSMRNLMILPNFVFEKASRKYCLLCGGLDSGRGSNQWTAISGCFVPASQSNRQARADANPGGAGPDSAVGCWIWRGTQPDSSSRDKWCLWLRIYWHELDKPRWKSPDAGFPRVVQDNLGVFGLASWLRWICETRISYSIKVPELE